jgi:hypothetical protein
LDAGLAAPAGKSKARDCTNDAHGKNPALDRKPAAAAKHAVRIRFNLPHEKQLRQKSGTVQGGSRFQARPTALWKCGNHDCFRLAPALTA